MNALENYRQQFRIGKRVEMEHHMGIKMAMKIARDHLREDRHYYTKLRKAKL